MEGKVEDKNLESLIINDKPIMVNPDGTFTATVAVMGPSGVSIFAKDKAGNTSDKAYFVQAEIAEGKLKFKFANLSSGMIVKYDDLDYSVGDTNYYYTEGIVNRPVKVVKVQGKVVPVKDLMFEARVDVKEGITKVPVYIEELDGTVAVDYAYNLFYDATAPKVELTKPAVISSTASSESYYKASLQKDGTVNVKGTVADNTFGYTFYVNGNAVFVSKLGTPAGLKETEKPFDIKVPAKIDDTIRIEAVDVFGNTTTRLILVVKEIKVENKTSKRRRRI